LRTSVADQQRLAWKGYQNKGVSTMKKIVLVTVAAVALMGTVAACGKGKAPPPAAAPIITKG
jgi:hypothetical protein